MLETPPIETHQSNISGENSAIRVGNADDPEDVQRLLDILNSADYQTHFTVRDDPAIPVIFTAETAVARLEADPYKQLDALLSKGKVLDEEAAKVTARFVVSGATVRNDPEVGKVQGIVSLYADTSYADINAKLDHIRAKNLLETQTDSPYNRLQITWVKHPDAKPRQMAAGVRQVLYALYKETARWDETGAPPKVPVVVLAYLSPNNADSIKVAEAAGFTKIHDDGEYGHDIWQLDWHIYQRKLKSKQTLTND